MTTFRYQEIFVGLVSAGIAAYLGWKIFNALRHGRIRHRGGQLTRTEPGRFGVLLGFHALVLLVLTVIAADLLFDLDLWNSL